MEEKGKLEYYRFISTLIGGGVFLCLMGFILYNQYQLLSSQRAFHKKSLAEQMQLVEAVKSSSSRALLANILNKVDHELNESPTNSLSDETIARIADLSHSFKPYRIIEGAGLSTKKYSPERGQLLMALCKMDMDTASFKKIILKTSFAAAELSGVNLKGIKLPGVNLEGANLEGANLEGADLKEANLKEANFSRASLSFGNLSFAKLESTNLNNALFVESKLKNVNLNGANLKEAFFRKANLSGAVSKYADWSGALLNSANLNDAVIFDSDLSHANLMGASLFNGNFRKTTLSNADLRGVELSGLVVQEENWLNKLNDWGVFGREFVQKEYQILSDEKVKPYFRIEKITNSSPKDISLRN